MTRCGKRCKKPANPVLTVDVTRCLRCGKDHKRLGFAPFKKRSITGFNYWATCPVTGEPLLLGGQVLEDNDEYLEMLRRVGARAVESK